MDLPRLTGIRACVFDAYGTLFDVGSVARGAQEALGEPWERFSDLWRAKQLQYTWLRGLAGRHADFWQVTGDALDFAMAAFGHRDPALRKRLMDLYLRLSVYPEVPDLLRCLKARGLKVAILSNGTPAMLASAVGHGGLRGLVDLVLSVEEAGVYKPHPAVYALATRHLSLRPEDICFLSSNGWDAYAAKACGFRVLWCNRSGQPSERLPWTPDGEIATLAPLPDLLAE
jgi:2-haloacid dehalogenase